ncbi:MAG: sigma-70 family RNA polymerase sigma factor [Acidimicrobiales bacterium]|nr:MAG: sigma-70 family RNA polymerase sigma factor [Acidimicrobiales bacterium]
MEAMRRVSVKQRGPQTIEDLFHAEYNGMVRLAYTLVNNNAEAEEIVQDSFAEVHRRFDELRQPGAYLRTTVVLRCRSLLRRRRVMERHAPEPLEQLPASACELWDVLNKLDEDQRVAVVLRYLGQYRASEIAEIMDMPAATVRSHVRRGLAILRKELEQ